jgi:hypothetical protein
LWIAVFEFFVRKLPPVDRRLAMLRISPEKVCYIIVKARMFDGKVEIDDPEPASNPSDDKNIDVLEDLPDDPTLDELIGAIQILNEDETLDLVALNWIGRGDYTAKELPEAQQQAREIPMNDRAAIQERRRRDYLEEPVSARSFLRGVRSGKALTLYFAGNHPIPHQGAERGARITNRLARAGENGIPIDRPLR